MGGGGEVPPPENPKSSQGGYSSRAYVSLWASLREIVEGRYMVMSGAIGVPDFLVLPEKLPL